MSFVVSKVLNIVIFAAWFVVGTMVIKIMDRGYQLTKSTLSNLKTAKA